MLEQLLCPGDRATAHGEVPQRQSNGQWGHEMKLCDNKKRRTEEWRPYQGCNDPRAFCFLPGTTEVTCLNSCFGDMATDRRAVPQLQVGARNETK